MLRGWQTLNLLLRLRNKMSLNLRAMVELLRPHQWVKNGFVLVGVLFSVKWISLSDWEHALLAFVAFCCAASAIYALNDWKDADADRIHVKKRHRPIASGRISKKTAMILGMFLVSLSFAFATLASVKVLFFVVGYILINAAYTLRLKQEVVVDVFCIFGGFMMRLLAGTVGIGIQPSRWLLITGMMITLFLGFGKRRAELASAEAGGIARKSLEKYSLPLLDKFISVCAAGTVITYGLYTVDESTIALHGTENLIWTMPIVIFGIFRYLYLIHRKGKGEDTSKDLFKDLPMLLAAVGWVTAVAMVSQG